MRESFVFYKSFLDATKEMADKDRLETLLAICNYALCDIEPELSNAMSRAVFTIARPSIDANNIRRANGKKGGRPKKETNGFDENNHGFSKEENTVSVSESESVSESGAEKPPAIFPHSPKRKYGRYSWVKLTDEEYARLVKDLGETELDRCIACVDEKAQMTKNKNRWHDWNLVIRKCHREGWDTSNTPETGGRNFDDVL